MTTCLQAPPEQEGVTPTVAIDRVHLRGNANIKDWVLGNEVQRHATWESQVGKRGIGHVSWGCRNELKIFSETV